MTHDEDTTAEEWRPVVGFDGYEVSSHGRVRSLRNTRHTARSVPLILRATKNSNGYPQVTLRRPPRQHNTPLHRIVLEAFVGPRPPGHVCAHHDGDKWNSRLSNLRWTTQSENVADTARHGRLCVGDRNPKAKLTPQQVREIRERVGTGAPQRQLGAEYGVSEQTISSIWCNRTWKQ